MLPVFSGKNPAAVLTIIGLTVMIGLILVACNPEGQTSNALPIASQVDTPYPSVVSTATKVPASGSKSQPSTAEDYYNRGLDYYKQKQEEEAIADFQKVLEISNDPKARAEAEAGLKALDGK